MEKEKSKIKSRKGLYKNAKKMFGNLKRSQFIKEIDRQFYHQEADSTHDDTTVCKLKVGFPTAELFILLNDNVEGIKILLKRFQNLDWEYNSRGNLYLTGTFIGKAVLDSDDTYNEFVGRDISYSKCLIKALSTLKNIIFFVNDLLLKQCERNTKVRDFIIFCECLEKQFIDNYSMDNYGFQN